MVNAIFERFLESNHLTMMVWAILARIFAPEALDELFEKEQLLVMQSEFPSVNVPILPGYELWIIDGNHTSETEHRLKVLRFESAGVLPGQSLVVLDPDRELVVNVFPCDDSHAQGLSMLPQVLE